MSNSEAYKRGHTDGYNTGTTPKPEAETNEQDRADYERGLGEGLQDAYDQDVAECETLWRAAEGGGG